MKPRLAILILLLGAAAARPADAQRAPRLLVRPELGLAGARNFSDDQWTVGGYLRVPLVGTLDLRPGGDYAMGGDHDYQLNADLSLRGPRDLAWLGGGVAWVHRDFGATRETRTGANLFIGFKPVPREGAQLFVEARWTLVSSRTLFRGILGIAIGF